MKYGRFVRLRYLCKDGGEGGRESCWCDIDVSRIARRPCSREWGGRNVPIDCFDWNTRSDAAFPFADTSSSDSSTSEGDRSVKPKEADAGRPVESESAAKEPAPKAASESAGKDPKQPKADLPAPRADAGAGSSSGQPDPGTASKQKPPSTTAAAKGEDARPAKSQSFRKKEPGQSASKDDLGLLNDIWDDYEAQKKKRAEAEQRKLQPVAAPPQAANVEDSKRPAGKQSPPSARGLTPEPQREPEREPVPRELTAEEIEAMKLAARRKREDETRDYIDLRRKNCVMAAFEETLSRDMKDGTLMEMRNRFGLEWHPSFS
ncbi:hypothetical protein DFJ74DRAFT_16585 [Hyaloraphidium curvatum]|nr:hypothetical protein DFJ74DRAFT_16585 [Hyaloraphidium curvatum]